MYANIVHNGAGDGVIVPAAKQQAVQLGDVYAVQEP